MSASITASCQGNPTTFLFLRNLDGRVPHFLQHPQNRLNLLHPLQSFSQRSVLKDPSLLNNPAPSWRQLSQTSRNHSRPIQPGPQPSQAGLPYNGAPAKKGGGCLLARVSACKPPSQFVMTSNLHHSSLKAPPNPFTLETARMVLN